MENPTGHRDAGLKQPDSQADEGGLSLSQLTNSFARLFGRGDKSVAAPDAERDPQPTPAAVDESPAMDRESATDGTSADACSVTPKSILEAILFVGHPDNEPLPAPDIASLMRDVQPDEVGQLVAELNADYSEQGTAFKIESSTGGYRMALRSSLSGLRERFYGRIREIRLSQTAIDVLAVVAYSQPITRHEIDELRGRPCGGVLTQLVRRQLLRIHRDEEHPRHVVYHTTDRFLKLFGLDSLEELPHSQMTVEEP